MKKHLKTFKRIIATLLLATILCSNIVPNTAIHSDTISTFAGKERSDSEGFPCQ